MKQKTRSGFTLPEVLMAAVVAGMVFLALGTLLSRSFSIWYTGMAQWKLATHARVARIRMLDGGFGRGTGILSSDNHAVVPYGSWQYVQYYPMSSGKEFRSYGWISDAGSDNIWLEERDSSTPEQWAYAQNVKYYDSAYNSEVKISSFDADIDEDSKMLKMTYTLHFSAGGKSFEQPQTIQTVLLNGN